jgi:hypothetical protein
MLRNSINPGREIMTYVARRNSFVAVLGSASMLAMLSAGAAQAVDLDLMISDVDGKANIVAEFAARYKEVAPDVNITLNVVGYEVVRDQLAVQLEAGTGPDLAFVTTLGALQPYYVDLTPFVDAEAWEAAYGAVLPWYRAGVSDGIYGFHTEMTVTGPYVNLTMFEEAGVELPAPGATWEDWAEATRQVHGGDGRLCRDGDGPLGPPHGGPRDVLWRAVLRRRRARHHRRGLQDLRADDARLARGRADAARHLAGRLGIALCQRQRAVLRRGSAVLHVGVLEHRQRAEQRGRQVRLGSCPCPAVRRAAA